MELGKSMEDYLEAILILKKKTGNVRSIDVARYLEFSKPSVSHAVKELRKRGYLEMKQDGFLELTETGNEIAEQIYDRHCFLKKFFIQIGVSSKLAEQDACQIEHIISEETFKALKRNYYK